MEGAGAGGEGRSGRPAPHGPLGTPWRCAHAQPLRLCLQAVHETILSNRLIILRAKELRCGREQSRRFYREHAGRRRGVAAGLEGKDPGGAGGEQHHEAALCSRSTESQLNPEGSQSSAGQQGEGGDLQLCSVLGHLTCSTASRWGVLSTGGTWSCWSTSRGPQK